MPYEQKVRTTPRISLNKLGEYLTATPARRRSIISDQKYPPTVQVIRYGDAEKAIAEYLVTRDAAALRAAKAALQAAPPNNESDRQRLEVCVAAIEAFESMDELDFGDAVAEPCPTSAPNLAFEGVSVSVRPNIILSRTDKKGVVRHGMVKLYLSKSFPLDERAGAYVAAVGQQYVAENVGPVDHSLVHVVDVFAGEVHVSPRAITRRLADVRAACEEIAVRWGSL